MNIFFIIMAVLLGLITISIFISAELRFNVYENIGFIKIKLFKIVPLFYSKIKLQNNYINLKSKKRNIKLKLDVNDESWELIKIVNAYFANKIYFNELNLNLVLSNENVSFIATASGFVNVLLSIVLSAFKNAHTECVISKNIETGFRHNVIDCYLKASVAVSLLDYLWSYYKAIVLLKRRKHVKKIERKKNSLWSWCGWYY